MQTKRIYKKTTIMLQALFLTGVLLSFFGWIWETILANFILQNPNDRGFLMLPLCPIYGFAIIFTYLFFGTPKKMQLFGKEIFPTKPFLRYFLYFLLSVLSATAIELLTGLFFDQAFHIRLWNYIGYFRSLGGYVAIFPSLGWGVAITVFMGTIWEPLFQKIQTIPTKRKSALFWTLLILIGTDTIVSYIILIQTGMRFVSS